MKKRKILWGVCGIGLGHARRQLPLIRHYARSSEIVLFTYGSGLVFFRKQLRDFTNIQVHEVSVPYWPGKPAGLDFAGAARADQNIGLDPAINAVAMAKAERKIGAPHLVISDYEPVCAQYAYAFSAPLVTLDQQSKFIGASMQGNLAGTTSTDEVMRLGMFFPKAEKRLACSFFRVPQEHVGYGSVKIIPSILGDDIFTLKQQPDPAPLVLVYLSEQLKDPGYISSLVSVLAQNPTIRFAVYLPKAVAELPRLENVRYYKQGSTSFRGHLASCHGIIATAGHSLLSEAMHLNIPVLAVPLKLYEQQMNAYVLQKGGFGLSISQLTNRNLKEFLAGLGDFRRNIRYDRNLLLKGNGLTLARDEINDILSY